MYIYDRLLVSPTKVHLFQLLLFEATGDSKYSRDVQAFLNEWRPSGTVQYTPGGLAWRGQWGSLRYAGSDVSFVGFHGKNSYNGKKHM